MNPPPRGGWYATDALERGVLELAGRRRSYWLARAAAPQAPLLVALHGSGTTGRNLAAHTGLAVRGPAAGVTVLFPDAIGHAWQCGEASSQRSDEIGFLEALIARLVADGTARPGPPTLVGLSNGALFAEQSARLGLLPVAGLALVSGSTLAWARARSPRPLQQAAVIAIEGTADPLLPYAGGPLGAQGVFGAWVRRRRRSWLTAAEATIVAAETVAADWAAGNGIVEEPVVAPLALPDTLPVTRLAWGGGEAPPVALYRIEGGGHGWPGGPQYLPSRLIGPIARLDATGLVLELAAT